MARFSRPLPPEDDSEDEYVYTPPRASTSQNPQSVTDSGAVASRRLSAEDRLVLRGAASVAKPSRGRHEPAYLVAFLDAFPGVRGFFTELALLRERPPTLTVTGERCLNDLINVLAYLRIAKLRSASACSFCSMFDAPFCAIAPSVKPAGARQHCNAKSNKCVLARAFYTANPTKDRVFQILFNAAGQLRLHKDTDDQGGEMVMLFKYAAELWCTAHHVGVQRIADAIALVFDKHGLPLPDSSNGATSASVQQALERSFVQLLVSVDRANPHSLSPTHRGQLDALVRLHAAMFGADSADYAMQATLIVLDKLLHTSTSRSARPLAEVVEAPEVWLVAEAKAAHAIYPPDCYVCADGTTVSVNRDLAQAQSWLGTLNDTDTSAQTTPPSSPPRSAGRTRSFDEIGEGSNDDEEEEIAAGLHPGPRSVGKRRRLDRLEEVHGAAVLDRHVRDERTHGSRSPESDRDGQQHHDNSHHHDGSPDGENSHDDGGEEPMDYDHDHDLDLPVVEDYSDLVDDELACLNEQSAGASEVIDEVAWPDDVQMHEETVRSDERGSRDAGVQTEPAAPPNEVELRSSTRSAGSTALALLLCCLVLSVWIVHLYGATDEQERRRDRRRLGRAAALGIPPLPGLPP